MSLKMNVKAWLELEPSEYDVALQLICHNTSSSLLKSSSFQNKVLEKAINFF